MPFSFSIKYRYPFTILLFNFCSRYKSKINETRTLAFKLTEGTNKIA